MNGTAPPTIDEAIVVIGNAEVRWILGHAGTRGEPGFEAYGIAAELDGSHGLALAYHALAGANEADVRLACRSIDALTASALDGSCRALRELQRRGISLGRDARYAGAWL